MIVKTSRTFVSSSNTRPCIYLLLSTSFCPSSLYWFWPSARMRVAATVLFPDIKTIIIVIIIIIIILLYTLPPEAVPPARPIMKGVFIATATPACAAGSLLQELSPQRGVRTPGTGT